MIVVLFVVEFKKKMISEYLKLTETLHKELNKQEGFISLERYCSFESQNRMVSIQFWENEEAIIKWKNNKKHQEAMVIGLTKLFKNYSIHVLSEIRSYKR